MGCVGGKKIVAEIIYGSEEVRNLKRKYCSKIRREMNPEDRVMHKQELWGYFCRGQRSTIETVDGYYSREIEKM